MDIPIIYEDKNLLAVNKPAGFLVHADGRSKEKTLTDWVLEKYPEIKGVGGRHEIGNDEGVERAGILHRLDKETSGVVLIAKNQEAFDFFYNQFFNRLVQKKYLAFVEGDIRGDFGVIDRPIGRSRSDFRKRSADDSARGKLRSSITEYRVLGRGVGATFVEVMPKTGRTHQIRVHFDYIGHPVVADPLYGGRKANMLGFSRLALHAKAISLKNLDGKEISVTAPEPEDFKKAAEMLEKAKSVAN